MSTDDFNDSGDMKRRPFLQLLGTSVAIPSLAACTRQPEERIVPFVKTPEASPGTPQFYASVIPREGVARGVLVETHAGRPTKIEGNPEHPASRGASDALQQAEILRLYDPDRSRAVRHAGAVSSWGAFLTALSRDVSARKMSGGRDLCLLTGAISSPTLRRQLRQLAEELPQARWYVHEPASSDGPLRGSEAAFGERLWPLFDMSEATVVLGLDADPMTEDVPAVTRSWAEARRRGIDGGEPIRTYALECTPGLFGAMADHRRALSPDEIEHAAKQVAAKVLDLGPADEKALLAGVEPVLGEAWLSALVADLKAAGGRALVLAGRHQPPVVHELAHRMNAALGAVGKTVRFVAPSVAEGAGDLEALHRRLVAGEVGTLVIMDTNPVYSAPADIDFAESIGRAKTCFHLGHELDETGERCEWHAPLAHPLEAWGDALAEDGTASVIQPTIEPLHGGRSPVELFAALLGHAERTGLEAVQVTWRERLGLEGLAFERAWRRVLHHGLDVESASEPVDVSPVPPTFAPAPEPQEGLSLVIRPSPLLRGGRFAGNGWLQELPQPLTKLTWDNVVLVSPSRAAAAGLENGDVVRITAAGASVEAPIWVMAGQPEATIAVHLGYGRERAGRVGTGVGFSAYALQTSKNRWQATGATMVAVGRRHELASAQEHQQMEGRDLVRHASLAAYRKDPHVLEHGHHGKPLTLYPDRAYEGRSWGMAIDLSTCVGCSACVVACQAENNIPVVGKEQVAMGREMHWLRIDHYVEGPADEPTTHFQPIPCMHCDSAPCEVVCPVQATAHHDEGLNDMVYNRCVGTRYCSNNCPYKVRRFNYFGYATENVGPMNVEASIHELGHNPDVTVRTRGVMEKCTYCVQRINHARVTAKRESRSIRDGEVMTACQAACPAQAITFGDMNDPTSRVKASKSEARNYGLLEELNTKPRTTYLAKLTNPNPELAGSEHGSGTADGHGHEKGGHE